ncbi:MAG: CDP-alcohol phosphatidyltransferase family protein [Candidatus Latescibacterota bacterium]
MGSFNTQLLYCPSTIIDYVRVVLLGIGIGCHGLGNEIGFVGFVMLSSVLDMVDGMLARRLGQTSRFGEVLDFCIDLITHTVLWGLSGFPFAPVMIFLEWGAGVSMFWLSVKQREHWKTTLATINVKLIERYFANRQRNVLAAFAGVSHFGFRIAWYLGYGEMWPADIFLPGVILFEVVTAYMIWIAWRVKGSVA